MKNVLKTATKTNRKGKLSFIELKREMHLLSNVESAEILAGNGFPTTTTTPDCFFDVIHYIDSYYGGSTGQRAMESAFNSQYGNPWETIVGVSSIQAVSFASEHFTITSNGFPMSSWQSELDNGTQIIAAWQLGGDASSTHAVVVTGYDISTNTYTVCDASYSKQRSTPSSEFRTDVLSIGICTEMPHDTTTALPEEDPYTTTVA